MSSPTGHMMPSTSMTPFSTPEPSRSSLHGPDDDVTGRQCRRRLRFDPCFEDVAVHKCIDNQWRSQAIGSQTSNEDLGFPVAERDMGGKTAASGRPSGALCQTCAGRSLIEK